MTRRVHRTTKNEPGGRRSLGVLPALWRFLFAVHRPRSWLERRQLMFRAVFFFALGVLAVLAVEAVLGRLWPCPK